MSFAYDVPEGWPDLLQMTGIASATGVVLAPDPAKG
jgi:hypothetical protein